MGQKVIWLLSCFTSCVIAGFLQLTDRQTPVRLDGSTTAGKGYVYLKATDSVFKDHSFESETYTVTLWVQETTAAGAGLQAIIHFQSVLAYNGAFGTMLPSIYKTAAAVTGCVDTTDTTNWCKATATAPATLWTWTHYFVSVCKQEAELRVCYTPWRSEAVCERQALTGNMAKFDLDSWAYIGGSPYYQGVRGKIADARYYDSSCYGVLEAQFLADNRRCSIYCGELCWGPDATSCSGLELLDQSFSTYLDTTHTLTTGYLRLDGTDVLFKGRQFGSQEMSVSAWVYLTDTSTATIHGLWRFATVAGDCCTVGQRIMTMFAKADAAIFRSALDNAGDFGYVMPLPSIANKWMHFAMSISQNTQEFIVCATEWKSAVNCVKQRLTGNVVPFTTAGWLDIGSSTTYQSIRGRIVDLRFWENQALTEVEFGEQVDRKLCAPNCNGSCWGPDTYACSDYIQLTDPQFSMQFPLAGNAPYEIPGSEPRLSNYIYGSTNYSSTMWVKRQPTSVYTYDTWETLLKVYHIDSNCCAAGTRQPANYIHAGNFVYAGASSTTNTDYNVESVVENFDTTWIHVATSATATTNMVCVTNFDLNIHVTKCKNRTDVANTVGWNRNLGTAKILVGSDAMHPGFRGWIVDARYYPGKALTEQEVKDMIDGFTCVGNTDNCTGADHLSMHYIRITDEHYEYPTYSTGGSSLAYFYIKGTHHLWYKNPFASSTYQLTQWVVGEDRIAHQTNLNRLQRSNCEAGTNYCKLPGTHSYNTFLHSCVDSNGSSDQCSQVYPPSAEHLYKTAFNTWASVCNGGVLRNCYKRWKSGIAASCVATGALTNPVQQFNSAGWMYFGGDNYAIMNNSNMRTCNVIYYPNSCYDDTQIEDALKKFTCAPECNNTCYGPGMNSCLYDEPVYLVDEWVPFVGDGATYKTTRGYEEAFEGRFMSYKTYSLCTWFYVGASYGGMGDSVFLGVFTDVKGSVQSNQYRQRTPALALVNNGAIQGQVTTHDGTFYSATINGVSLQRWYLGCVVVDGAAETIQTFLAPFDGAVTASFAQSFAGKHVGYPDSNTYFYYGGISTTGSQKALTGQILDLRFWDTRALTSADITALVQAKLCHGRCTTCSGPTAEFCSACRNPFLLDENSCVKQCPAAKFSDGIECQTCDPACTSCTGAGPDLCTQCETGTPHYRQETSCKLSCDQGWYPTAAPAPDYQCLNCHEGCTSCTGPAKTQCSQCAAGWYLQPNVATTCEQTCPTDCYKNDTDRRCDTCATECLTCFGGLASQCTACKPGVSYMQPGSHTCGNSCPTYYFQSGADCLPCAIGCKTCGNPGSADCTECRDGYFKKQTTDVCVPVCDPKYYLDTSTNECEECFPYCDLCFGPNSTECTKCDSVQGYYLQPEPNEHECGTTCPAGYWQNLNGGNSVCSPCFQGCTTCSGGAADTNCNACTIGYYMQGGTRCQRTCDNGFWPNTAGNTCDSCDLKCTTCFGPADTECTVCAINNFLQPSPSTSKTCKADCPTGYYPNVTQCDMCHEACTACTGAGNTGLCTACVDGYYLHPITKICTKCEKSCEVCRDGTNIQCDRCSFGYFLKEGRICEDHCGPGLWKDWSDKTCKSCNSPCADCETNPDFCSKCVDKYYIENGRSLNNCMACYQLCLTCSGPLENECLSCDSTAYPHITLADGRCSCEGGYYFSTPTVCSKCHDACTKCSQSGRVCDDCPFGKLGKECRCPGTYYEKSDYTCGECHYTCETCTGPLISNCLACKQLGDEPTFLLPSGECQASDCPIWTYPDVRTYSCQPCHETCKSCSGPHEDQCKSCNTDAFYFDKGRCYSCDEGYELNSGYCKEICGDGLDLGQYGCDDGNRENFDGCSSTCEVEIGWVCSSINAKRSFCEDVTPPVATLITAVNENELILQLDEKPKFEVTEANLRLQIGRLSPSDYTWTIQSTSLDKKTYTINYELKTKLYRETFVAVVFNENDPIQDVYGNKMIVKEINTKINAAVLSHEESEEEYELEERKKEAFEVFGSVIGYTTLALMVVTLSLSLALKVI